SPAPALAAAFDPTKVNVALRLVENGFINPLLVTNARDGSGRLFVVQHAGRIRIIDGGTVLASPCLVLRRPLRRGGERRLRGLAGRVRVATGGQGVPGRMAVSGLSRSRRKFGGGVSSWTPRTGLCRRCRHRSRTEVCRRTTRPAS